MTTIDPADGWRRAAWGSGDPSAAPHTAITPERTDRVEANAKYQAFAAGSEARDTCHDFEEPNHDYDRCVRVEIENPVLFLKETSDMDEVNLNDVKQLRVGDCDLMAAVAALSTTAEGRALIKGAIVQNRNDRGEVVSYTVTLHKPTSHWPLAKTFREVQMTVDGTYVVGHAGARTSSDGLNEVWPLVIEKAYAQYMGSYNAIGRGGNPGDAMEALTGREATSTMLRGPRSLFNTFRPAEIQSDLAMGKLVVLETRGGIGQGPNTRAPTRTDSHKLIHDHAYVVTGVVQQGGQLCVQLYNPWEDQQPDFVPVGEIPTWFQSVSVGSVR